MSKDEKKIREALKREALEKVQPGKAEPKPLEKILGKVKDDGADE